MTYPQTRWTLEKLLPAPEGAEVEALIQKLETAAAAVEALRPTLSPEIRGEDFVKILKMIETIAEISAQMGDYGQLWFAEDTQNQQALAMMGRMDQLLTEIYNRILFVSLWWKSLDDQTAQRLLAYSGDLRYYLEKERLFKAHTLTEPEEKIINLKDVNGANALVTLYDMITNKFVFELEVDGEKKKLTREELMVYVRHPSPDVRAAAYQEQFRVYRQETAVLAQIYMHRVRDGPANICACAVLPHP